MKGFILAAGLGERLRPLTDKVPKPLIPVAGVPSICYSLALLKKYGITHVICNLHYRYRDVLDFFRRNKDFGFTLKFSIEEKLLGTGGGLKKCESFLKDDNFILLNSDVITDLNIEDMKDEFQRSGEKETLSLYPLNKGNLPGTVSVNKGLIADFNGILDSGIPPLYDYMGAALLTPTVFDYLLPEHSCIVKTGYSGLVRERKLVPFFYNGIWMDIGSHEKLNKANIFFQKEKVAFVKEIRKLLGEIK